jgi:hypothetical protein
MADSPSPRGSLNQSDLVSLLKGAAIAGAGVVLARIAEGLPGIDFGAYGDVIAGVLMIAINALRKWLAGQSA